MNRELYWVCCTIAGRWRRGFIPYPHSLCGPLPRKLPKLRAAVYIVTDEEGPYYVGSTARRAMSAVRRRIGEHVRDRDKARSWLEVWVVPLKPDTPRPIVRSIEGRIGARLRPRSNTRLPQF